MGLASGRFIPSLIFTLLSHDVFFRTDSFGQKMHKRATSSTAAEWWVPVGGSTPLRKPEALKEVTSVSPEMVITDFNHKFG